MIFTEPGLDYYSFVLLCYYGFERGFLLVLEQTLVVLASRLFSSDTRQPSDCSGPASSQQSKHI